MDDRSRQPPVFVAASVRSGSTLLHLMLDAHPRVSNPGECDFMFDRLDDDGNAPDMLEYHEWLSLDRIFLAKSLEVHKDLPYRDLMYSFLAELHRSKPFVALNVHRNFHRIPVIFADAKFLHLVRDPRDVARSCVGMGWAGHVYYGVDIWIRAETSWNRLVSTLDEQQYMEVRYEDLIERCEDTLREICRFIGVEYDVEMMGYHQRSSYALPDSRLRYQWRNNYGPRELQLVEAKLDGLLQARGYAPSGVLPATPGPRELLTLSLRNKLSRLWYGMKKYGPMLFIARRIATRLKWNRLLRFCQVRINRIDTRGLK